MLSKNYQPPLILGVVVPKSGSTTLTRLINGEYSRKKIFNFRNDKQGLLRVLDNHETHKYSVIIGRGDVATVELVRKDSRPVVAFTLIRDPIERLLSSFRAGLGSDTRMAKNDRKVSDAEEWLLEHQKKYSYVKNLAMAKSAEEAIAEMEKTFQIIGTVENFPIFLDKLNTQFGWKLRQNVTINVSNLPAQNLGLSENFLKYLSGLMREDVKLYEFFRKKNLSQEHRLQKDIKTEWLKKRLVHKLYR